MLVIPESTHSLVQLRTIQASDLPIWSEYLHLQSVYEHTSWNFPTPDELSEHIWNPDTNAAQGILRLGIALRTDDSLVGTIGFHSIVRSERSGEIAYDLAPSMWGNGIATVMAQVMVRWARTELGMDRIRASVLESNTRSVRVLEKAGFRLTGVSKAHRVVRGHPRDFLQYENLLQVTSSRAS